MCQLKGCGKKLCAGCNRVVQAVPNALQYNRRSGCPVMHQPVHRQSYHTIPSNLTWLSNASLPTALSQGLSGFNHNTITHNNDRCY